jgi:hypothetical protein
MGFCSFSRLAALFAMLLLAGVVPFSARGQEIPLQRCDALPVMEVSVGGQPMRFLVDTAATSFLNLKSFSEGKSRDVRVTSWSGTLATSAREVTLKEVVIGSTKLMNLTLPAVDLSAVGNACGKKIDGILGVDLLAKLGATIDLKKQTLHVTTVSEQRGSLRRRCTVKCIAAWRPSTAPTRRPLVTVWTQRLCSTA